MASKEQKSQQPDEELPQQDETQSAEFSLDQLSQAYAQVMREQGALEADSEPLDESFEEPIEDAEPVAAEKQTRSKKTLEQIDTEDNSNCPVSPKSIVESMLFVGAPSGVNLTARILASSMRDVSPKEIKNIVKELNQDYVDSDAPFRVVLEDKNYKMKLNDEMLDVQNHYFGRNRPAKLSQSAIDVLAIVAYNQPVSRSQVDAIRTRPSGGVLNQLARRDLLVADSVSAKPKEIVFRTTDRFLQLFGLGTLDDLPQTSIASDLEELSDF